MFSVCTCVRISVFVYRDRLCGLVVRVPGYTSWLYEIFWEVVGLERGPLSLVRITEELFEDSRLLCLEIQN